MNVFLLTIIIFSGFVKGFGKGVVGVIAQPATGVIDFASGSLNAFDNVIDTKQVIKAVRPTRYFAEDHKLTPYVKHAADGMRMMIMTVPFNYI